MAERGGWWVRDVRDNEHGLWANLPCRAKTQKWVEMGAAHVEQVSSRGCHLVLPFQPRSYIHLQNSQIAHSIDESYPFLIGSTVVLGKQQPPLVYFRLGCLKALLHLRPIGFELGRLI